MTLQEWVVESKRTMRRLRALGVPRQTRARIVMKELPVDVETLDQVLYLEILAALDSSLKLLRTDDGRQRP